MIIIHQCCYLYANVRKLSQHRNSAIQIAMFVDLRKSINLTNYVSPSIID